MRLSKPLFDLSKLVIAGRGDGSLEVVESECYSDFTWIIYAIPYLGATISAKGALSRVLFDRAVMPSSDVGFVSDVNSPVIEAPAGLAMPCTTAREDDVISWYQKESHENGYRVITREYKWGDSIATPFLPIGSRVPVEVSVDELITALDLLGNPLSTLCLVVGDGTQATEVLGEGLENLRAIVCERYGILPADNAVPLDMPLPFLYRMYPDHEICGHIPNICLKGGSESGYDRAKIIEESARRLISVFYNLLEGDQGYRGREPLEDNLGPRDSMCWHIDSSSSRTPVPYRYPALVSLLSELTKSKAQPCPEHPVYEVGLVYSGALQSALSKGLLAGLKGITTDKTPSDALLDAMVKLCVAFMVRLYRLTCKVIEMPSRKKFPRRTEASRLFESIFNRYSESSTLTDYITLGKSAFVWSLVRSKYLAEASQATGFSPLSLLKSRVVPPIVIRPSTGGDYLVGLAGGCIAPYKRLSRIVEDSGLESEVLFKLGDETYTPRELALSNILEILDKAEAELTHTGIHTALKSDMAYNASSYWGLANEMGPDGLFIETMLDKISVTVPILRGMSLKDVVEYYELTSHAVLGRIMDASIASIDAALMEPVYNTTYKWNMSSTQKIALIALRQHLSLKLGGAK